MTELPENYVAAMEKLLGAQTEEYLKSFQEVPKSGLRVNSLKVLYQKELLAFPGFENLSRVPWTENGFYYDESLKPSRHPFYYAGLYYLQEPSAMAPAACLPVAPGERVLDLCAAPGGKSTQLGVRLKGKGLLFANDISNSRAKALLKNIELFGIPSVFVSSESPDRLAACYPEFFDKILVDAPCSGEGMFRRDPDMIKSWREKGPDAYVPLQRDILRAAVSMLKPGGLLLYSTCTFAREEDEDQILTLLKEYQELSLMDLGEIAGADPGFDPEGRTRRFWPHRTKGEGHFLALIKKEGEALKPSAGRESRRNVSAVNPAGEDPFFSLISGRMRDYLNECVYLSVGSGVYALPKEAPLSEGIRFLRTGLYLGEKKKNRFEPSQALAMALRESEFANSVSFKADDPKVIKYLKGETLELGGQEDGFKEAKIRGEEGWCLVCVEGFPLGFAKRTKLTLKNKYCVGWRWLA